MTERSGGPLRLHVFLDDDCEEALAYLEENGRSHQVLRRVEDLTTDERALLSAIKTASSEDKREVLHRQLFASIRDRLPCSKKQEEPATEPPGSLSRFWRLFSYILPRSTRLRVFEPLYENMLADYLETRRYRTPWSRRWLRFKFGLDTARMIFGCLHAWAEDAMVAWLTSWVSAAVRRWFRPS